MGIGWDMFNQQENGADTYRRGKKSVRVGVIGGGFLDKMQAHSLGTDAN